MNDDVVEKIVDFTNNQRFALDTYRRFLREFGECVLNVDGKRYEGLGN